MGRYITFEDVEGRLTQERLRRLYRLPEHQADLDRDVAGVEALIDSYVGKRYQTPVADATAKEVLRKVALDLVEKEAYSRGAGDDIPEKVKSACDESMKFLQDVAQNKATLAGATEVAERVVGGAEAILVDGNAPEFDRPSMGAF